MELEILFKVIQYSWMQRGSSYGGIDIDAHAVNAADFRTFMTKVDLQSEQ